MLTEVAAGVLVHQSELLRNNTVVVVPGHGSVGRGDQVHARIELDRAYVHALRDGRHPDDDPRIGSAAEPGWEWVSDIHEGQARSVVALGDTPRVHRPAGKVGERDRREL